MCAWKFWIFFMTLKIPHGFFNSPCLLAASTLVTAYVISVRKQRWEFPILPWVKFTTSYEEEEIMKIVLTILMHVLKPDEIKDKNKRLFSI